MTLNANAQSASFGEMVTLFQLDCTSIPGGSVLHFTSSVFNDEAIVFNAQAYTPVDITAEGFEYSGQAAFPTPILKLSNVTKLGSALVLTYDDLIGAQLTRIRTLKQYLDDGATPDPSQIFTPDVYVVEQKMRHTRTSIEWKLSASIDQQGAKLPSYDLARDYCSREYRRYNAVTEETDYSTATCRYSGAYLDENGDVTLDPALDVPCPKTLTGCKDRFGANAPLPFKGCPGLGRFR